MLVPGAIPRHRSDNGPSAPQNIVSPTNLQKMPQAVRVSFLRRSSQNDENNRVSVSDFIMRNRILGNLCSLCEQSYQRDQMDSIADCGHIFCLGCLNSYCSYKINTMENVNCPQDGCAMLLDPEGTVFRRLPKESKDRYRRNALWKQTIDNPNLKLCATQDCEGVIDTSRGGFQCPKCKVKFCKECQLPQHRGACDTNFQQNFRDWKRCPQCHVFIERTEGCNHMTCRCEHQFCYVCLSNWNDSHYQCGSMPFFGAGAAIEGWSRCGQLTVGVILIILTPIFLVILLLAYILGVAIAVIAGFFIGPIAILSNNECCFNCCGFILCPLFMVVGAILGLFGGLGYGMYLGLQILVQFFRFVSRITCGHHLNIDNNLNDLLPDLPAEYGYQSD